MINGKNSVNKYLFSSTYSICSIFNRNYRFLFSLEVTYYPIVRVPIYDSGKLSDIEKCVERFDFFEASFFLLQISNYVKIFPKNENKTPEKYLEIILKLIN